MASRLEEFERLLCEMTRAEKAELLQYVVRDLGEAFPGIESSPDVCGGEARVVRTRIPVWVIEQALRLGTTEGEALSSFPTLRDQDMINARAYARSHRDEIDTAIRENEAA